MFSYRMNTIKLVENGGKLFHLKTVITFYQNERTLNRSESVYFTVLKAGHDKRNHEKTESYKI